MSRYLEPFEQLMVTMESCTQPMHAGSIELYRLPDGAPSDFVAKLAERMRAVAPQPPFDKTLEGRGWLRWKTAVPDMHYHVRHLRLPTPGSLAQLMEMTEGLYGSLLNRSLPLWECWLIDGIEEGRFAIVFKAHHALTDGIAGMRRFLDSLAITPDDAQVRAPWGDNSDSRVHGEKPAARTHAQARAARPRPALTLREVVDTARTLWPVKTQRSRLNGVPASSARRFGACTLSLPDMKAAGAPLGATINDVLVTLADHAANRYLAELGEPPTAPLAVLAAISTRREGATGGPSNQVLALPATLAAPGTPLPQRLRVIHDALRQGKEAAGKLPPGAGTGYTASAAALLPQLLEQAPGMLGQWAVSSMVVSNISPPRNAHYVDQPLYRAGACMEAFYIQPIINGGSLLNVTCMGYDGRLNVGIGSVPGAVDEPMRFGRYMAEALAELAGAPAPKAPRPAVKRARRKAHA
jgi:diacylglycerol O-acyltransferase